MVAPQRGFIACRSICERIFKFDSAMVHYSSRGRDVALPSDGVSITRSAVYACWPPRDPDSCASCSPRRGVVADLVKSISFAGREVATLRLGWRAN